MQIYRIKAGSHVIELGQKTKIMGILNLTPDSFSQDGSLSKSSRKITAYQAAKHLINEGADILDIGGESTRPGAKPISAQDEIKRVIPTLKKIIKHCRIPISIDTYKSEVAQAGLDEGACIVNNIMGADPDKHLLKIVKNYNAAIVLMHIRGNPQTMQKNIYYRNLIPDILKTLRRSIEICLEIGIKSDRILIDPGICFGKTAEDNLKIIQRLNEFQQLKHPILIGPSRKSFIGKILNKPVDQRLFGTIGASCACAMNGAHIIRVHDVKEVKDAVTLIDSIKNYQLS